VARVNNSTPTPVNLRLKILDSSDRNLKSVVGQHRRSTPSDLCRDQLCAILVGPNCSLRVKGRSAFPVSGGYYPGKVQPSNVFPVRASSGTTNDITAGGRGSHLFGYLPDIPISSIRQTGGVLRAASETVRAHKISGRNALRMLHSNAATSATTLSHSNISIADCFA